MKTRPNILQHKNNDSKYLTGKEKPNTKTREYQNHGGMFCKLNMDLVLVTILLLIF